MKTLESFIKEIKFISEMQQDSERKTFEFVASKEEWELIESLDYGSPDAERFATLRSPAVHNISFTRPTRWIKESRWSVMKQEYVAVFLHSDTSTEETMKVSITFLGNIIKGDY